MAKAKTKEDLFWAILFDQLDTVASILNQENAKELVNARDEHGETALYKAIDYRRVQITKLLIAKGADVNIDYEINHGIFHENRKALHIAIESNNKEIVEAVLERVADVNARDGVGRTALYMAAGNGNAQITKFLIAKGANVNINCGNDYKYRTALHRAVLVMNKDVVEALLEGGADVNAKDQNGRTALFNYNTKSDNPLLAKAIDRLVFQKATLSILDTLIKHGLDVNTQDNKGNTIFHANDDTDDYTPDAVLEHVLLTGKVNLEIRNNAGKTALDSVPRWIARYQKNLLLFLYEHGAEEHFIRNMAQDARITSAMRQEVFEVAIQRSNCALANHLIEYSSDKSFLTASLAKPRLVRNLRTLLNIGKGEALSCFAVEQRFALSSHIAPFLTENDRKQLPRSNTKTTIMLQDLVKPDYNRQKELLVKNMKKLAIYNRHLSALDRHCSAIAQKTDDQPTFAQIQRDINELLNRLPTQALSPAIKNIALLNAAKFGNFAMFELLLANGADINTRDKTGRTALYLAVEANTGIISASRESERDATYDKIIDLALARGADVNIGDHRNITPLHIVDIDSTTARKLLEHGANKDAKNLLGHTPTIICQYEKPGAMQLLRGFFADCTGYLRGFVYKTENNDSKKGEENEVTKDSKENKESKEHKEHKDSKESKENKEGKEHKGSDEQPSLHPDVMRILAHGRRTAIDMARNRSDEARSR